MKKLFYITFLTLLFSITICAMEKQKEITHYLPIPSLRSLSLLHLAKATITDEKDRILDLSLLKENEMNAILGEENDAKKTIVRKFNLDSIPQDVHSFLVLISLIKLQKAAFKNIFPKKKETSKAHINYLCSIFNYNKQQFYAQALGLDNENNNKNLPMYFAYLLKNPNTIQQWKKSTLIPFFINLYGIHLTCYAPPLVSAKNMRTIIIKNCKEFYSNFDLENSTIYSTAKDNDCFQRNDNDLIDLNPVTGQCLYNFNLK